MWLVMWMVSGVHGGRQCAARIVRLIVNLLLIVRIMRIMRWAQVHCILHGIHGWHWWWRRIIIVRANWYAWWTFYRVFLVCGVWMWLFVCIFNEVVVAMGMTTHRNNVQIDYGEIETERERERRTWNIYRTTTHTNTKFVFIYREFPIANDRIFRLKEKYW